MIELSIATALLAAMLWSSLTFAQPAAIPRIGQASRSANETFNKLRGYFSDEAANQFKLVKADPRSRTIVATRNRIDTGTWSQWAYCKMSPTHLLDSLDDGAVTVKIKVESGGRHSSYVNVDADFEGTYKGLGSAQTAQQCVSKGVLEQNILAAGGASQPST
jgi:hypothetical protein